MSFQSAHLRGCEVTLAAFVRFFSTMFSQMYVQMTDMRCNIITLVAFVLLDFFVCWHLFLSNISTHHTTSDVYRLIPVFKLNNLQTQSDWENDKWKWKWPVCECGGWIDSWHEVSFNWYELHFFCKYKCLLYQNQKVVYSMHKRRVYLISAGRDSTTCPSVLLTGGQLAAVIKNFWIAIVSLSFFWKTFAFN